MSPALESSELEIQWVRLAQAGDQQAYSELVRMYRDGVMRMVYRICGDMHLAEDVAQDTFLRAWQKLNMFQPRTSLRNWLYRIAANRTMDLLRREKSATDIEELDPQDFEKSPETRILMHERLGRVQSAVLSLPFASRSVLILREYEGLSYKEISETLDIPIGTVMSRINFARQKLMTILKDEMEPS
jgi:RNA polymerase sigma-70 factor (ECF subfamily)